MWPIKPPSHSLAHPIPVMLAIAATSNDREAAAEFGRRSGVDVTTASTLQEGFRIAARENTAVIVLDRDLAEDNWQATIQAFARRQPAASIILASRVFDDYLFEEMVKHGGFDIVAKPIRSDELRRIAGLALTFWRSRVESHPSV